MRIELERTVAGVAPERAIAWWRDFQEGHIDHAFMPGESRHIVITDGERTMMEDTLRWGPLTLFRERTTVRDGPGAVHFEGKNNFATFDGSYTFTPEADGVRIALRADIHLRGALRLTEAVARPVVRAILVADLKGHAADMARDLG